VFPEERVSDNCDGDNPVERHLARALSVEITLALDGQNLPVLILYMIAYYGTDCNNFRQ
jgi:hypothetical protein